MSDEIYSFSGTTMQGKELPLSEFKGKVLLIVNTASKCGFTPHKGLEILGFPCNQFGHQDPGSNEQINQFCELNYGVTFTMFEKVDVNGSSAHPLFKYLKKQAPGLLGSEGIKWNFTKFLVDSNGKVINRYAPTDTPEKIGKDVAKLLA